MREGGQRRKGEERERELEIRVWGKRKNRGRSERASESEKKGGRMISEREGNEKR